VAWECGAGGPPFERHASSDRNFRCNVFASDAKRTVTLASSPWPSIVSMVPWPNFLWLAKRAADLPWVLFVRLETGSFRLPIGHVAFLCVFLHPVLFPANFAMNQLVADLAVSCFLRDDESYSAVDARSTYDTLFDRRAVPARIVGRRNR
jgi:hypothetical protein